MRFFVLFYFTIRTHLKSLVFICYDYIFFYILDQLNMNINIIFKIIMMKLTIILLHAKIHVKMSIGWILSD